MNTLPLTVKYRPIRVGFCIREGNLDDLRNAIRLSSCLWGGRFNPIIPVGNKSPSDYLTKVFRVDTLYTEVEDSNVDAFIEKYPYLPSPVSHRTLFIGEEYSSYLDIQNVAATAIAESEHVEGMSPFPNSRNLTWNDDDALRDVYLATFGSFREKDITGIDYLDVFNKTMRPRPINLSTEITLPKDILFSFGPLALGEFKLELHSSPNHRSPRFRLPGFYCGRVDNFDDILNFWNLRATGLEIFFFDENHQTKLLECISRAVSHFKSDGAGEGNGRAISIWHAGAPTEKLKELLGDAEVIIQEISHTLWNGLNLVPPFVQFKEKRILGAVSAGPGRPILSIELPEKPFSTADELFTQHAIFSILPSAVYSQLEDFTFYPPSIPQLNEYYGRNFSFMWNGVRVEQEGIGIVVSIGHSDIRLYALPITEIFEKIFLAFGIKAERSLPGRIAERLIKQLGGHQGCRILKIPGVRALIEEHEPEMSFKRTKAHQTIRGPVDSVSNKGELETKYTDLVLRRADEKFNASYIFDCLLDYGVFRVGLDLECSTCHLTFWLPLDDIESDVPCVYCGNKFKIVGQLKDRDWAFRRSGLFGRKDNQQGAVPVAVLLQQLNTCLQNEALLGTAVNLTFQDGRKCETDFVVLNENKWLGEIEIGFGEVKNRGSITKEDVENMARVADQFENTPVLPFVIFAKLADFSEEEISLIKLAHSKYRNRVILMTRELLEPYFIYDAFKEKVYGYLNSSSLEGMANATAKIFFSKSEEGDKPVPL